MVMGSLWACHNMVVSASVSKYLGRRAQYVLIFWRSGDVNGYTKPNDRYRKSNIIIPYPSSFGKSWHLPLWVHIFLVKIYCLNIASYWPKQMTGPSTSFILMLNQPTKCPFSPLLYTISWSCSSLWTWYSTKSKTLLDFSLGLNPL